MVDTYRPMNVDEAIHVLQNMKPGLRGVNTTIARESEAIDLAILALNSALSKSIKLSDINSLYYDDGTYRLKVPVGHPWIPVTGKFPKLPAEGELVLVTNEYTNPDTGKVTKYVETAEYEGGKWYSYSDEYKDNINHHKVVAWKYLPSPYDGGDSNEAVN